MSQKVTAIFDIGKTNKKFFLFDDHLKVLHQESVQLEEIQDEDGFPCEDITLLMDWVKATFDRIWENEKFDIQALNFSSYGASLVHLDANGEILTPLYNYLKPYNQTILEQFFSKFGPVNEFSLATGAKHNGMLSAGLQLFWLKNTKPKIFNLIEHSLHLPQYLSYIFTGIHVSDYTSIGCHSGLWDYTKNNYHQWVFEEKLNEILAPITSTQTTYEITYLGKKLKVGVGIHDSSAALVPYLKGMRQKFVLISTGTWSVSLNPFADGLLSWEELDAGCLNYMTIDGKAVKSSKILLGKEYYSQLKKLLVDFILVTIQNQPIDFNPETYTKMVSNPISSFNWEYISGKKTTNQSKTHFKTFEEAYHQLVRELVNEQVESLNIALGKNGDINLVLVEGGFSNNPVFMNILANQLPEMEVFSANISHGAALGAALLVLNSDLNSNFLSKLITLKKYVPFPLK